MKILKKLMVLMDRKQKRMMCLLVVMMVIGALLETAGIGIVYPLIEAVVDENAISGDGIVSKLYRFLGMDNYTHFLILVLAGLIFVFVCKNLFLFLQQKMMYRFVYSNQFSTQERMLRHFMRQGYEFYLNAETAVIQRSIAADVTNMFALILSLLQVTSEGIVFVSLGVGIFLIDPKMTLVIAGILVVTLLVIKMIIKPIMKRTGEENQDYASRIYQWLAQTVGGIKEIKIIGKEQYFIEEYLKRGYSYVKAMERFGMYCNAPKLLIETVCIAGMAVYMLYLVLSGRELAQMLPSLSAFAVAAVRLMPSASRINNQLTQMAYYEPFFMNVSDNLVEEISDGNVDMSFAAVAQKKLPVEKEIVLEHITYAYPNNADKKIFDDAYMRIPVGTAVGIVGGSGAGKTTIVDILLGLLEVQGGRVLADGVDVMAHYRAWLKNVGYIPQMIYLLDDDIRKNVAFGIPEEEIDDARLWYALEEAQLDVFVRSLPEGVHTGIGERGIRLSGGQRQRIGIARALYHDPEVLILDEATSALDNDTEAAIMDSINRLHGKKTLVIIAHRLQTIEKCDMVYRVESGKIRQER